MKNMDSQRRKFFQELQTLQAELTSNFDIHINPKGNMAPSYVNLLLSEANWQLETSQEIKNVLLN
jgi:hypothetical protein